MELEVLFAELKQGLEKLGVEVREQALESEFGRAKSGLVRIRGQKIVLLDRELSLEDKVQTLSRILKQFDLEGIYLSPYLRKLLEDGPEK